MANFTQVVYVSSATVPFSKQDLLDLLEKSRANNQRCGVTGMLLFKDGNFMQVLEGEASAVTPLLQKIAADRRHNGVITLVKTEVSEREFGDWSMAFRDLSDATLTEHSGYSEFLNLPLTDRTYVNEPSKARSLLRMFRQNIR